MKKRAKITGWGDGTAQLDFKPDALLGRLQNSLLKLIRMYSEVFIGLAGLVVLIFLVYTIYQLF